MCCPLSHTLPYISLPCDCSPVVPDEHKGSAILSLASHSGKFAKPKQVIRRALNVYTVGQKYDPQMGHNHRQIMQNLNIELMSKDLKHRLV